jgi:hypothetical protein
MLPVYLPGGAHFPMTNTESADRRGCGESVLLFAGWRLAEAAASDLTALTATRRQSAIPYKDPVSQGALTRHNDSGMYPKAS